MTSIHSLRRTAIIVAFAVASGVALPLLISVTLANAPPAEWDGLVRVQNRRLDHMYLLPDVSFAGYTADARRALQQWADVLLTGLDDAEGRTPAA